MTDHPGCACWCCLRETRRMAVVLLSVWRLQRDRVAEVLELDRQFARLTDQASGREV
jgi:hypothetical protein